MARRFAQLLLLLLLTTPAIADPADDDVAMARRHYQRGIGHYNLQEFPEAIKEFKEAYRLHPDSAILFNLAQAQRLDHDNEGALSAYKAYLRSTPGASNRDEVLARITDLEAIIAKPKDAAMGPAPSTPAPTNAIASAPLIVAAAPAHPTARRRRWVVGVVVGAVVVVGAALGIGLGLGLQPTHNTYPAVTF